MRLPSTSRLTAALIPATAILVSTVGPTAAGAATPRIVVSKTTDGGAGSLRQAIADANPGDTVVVPAGTYKLTMGELAVNKSLTIAGADAQTTIIDAQSASRVFHTGGAASSITISGLEILSGEAVPSAGTTEAKGGGVLNDDARLTLSDDLIAGNVANADQAGAGGRGGTADGGGVFSAGKLKLVNDAFAENLATAQGAEGQVGGVANGGGAETTGSVTINGSVFAINGAEAVGGDVNDSTGAEGGDATGGGLAILQHGQASVSASTFEQNSINASGGDGAPGGHALGGGAIIDGGTGNISLTNVTFNQNLVESNAGITAGGGIAFDAEAGEEQSPESLINVTLSGDSAKLGRTNVGGEAFFNVGASATAQNTLIDSGTADAGSENCAMDGGTLSSLGHNIDSRDQCHFHADRDHVNTSPMLQPLAFTGLVGTLGLASGSPAINAGAAAACPSTDARGALRPAGNGCDIGAFEVAFPGATTTQPTSVTSTSAVANGVAVNPDLAHGTAFFQYGKTTAYGTRTAGKPVGAITRRMPISMRLVGLAPGTTYHYRIVVSNSVRAVSGTDQQLTTPQAK